MSMLQTKELAIGYGEEKVLSRGINLELNSGDFVGLVGQKS